MGLGKTVEVMGCILANSWKPGGGGLNTSRDKTSERDVDRLKDRQDGEERIPARTKSGQFFWRNKLLVCVVLRYIFYLCGTRSQYSTTGI